MTYVRYLRPYRFHIGVVLLILGVGLYERVFAVWGFMAVVLVVIGVGSYRAYMRNRKWF
jgi:ABC-type enterochelin transport system permease subunit